MTTNFFNLCPAGYSEAVRKAEATLLVNSGVDGMHRAIEQQEQPYGEQSASLKTEAGQAASHMKRTIPPLLASTLIERRSQIHASHHGTRWPNSQNIIRSYRPDCWFQGINNVRHLGPRAKIVTSMDRNPGFKADRENNQ
ncbi:hypothetical protein EMPG_10973 [Blastomyces silverae]|uniref:Uncharacterized protein n=1 Tax=Blastomyces silverae TaxID=2060906 RepID=A0A0H1B8I8_9EURO|nr:hypothetical protein EMPG_10973 [Blastomyces silverae]